MGLKQSTNLAVEKGTGSGELASGACPPSSIWPLPLTYGTRPTPQSEMPPVYSEATPDA